VAAIDVAARVDAPPARETPSNVAKTAAVPPDSSRYHRLSEFLAKRYRVSQAFTLDLVTIAHAAGQQVGLDPLLIIAVIAVESRFNPIAESVMGAKGLMQVIPRFHAEKFRELGGEQYAVFDPETNILVGARILKEYLSRTGSLSSALRMYVGSSNAEDSTYMDKVMTEKERLQQVLHRGAPPKPSRADASAGELLALAER
jgi:soluble lytic murein transglycosylase-like protein